MIIASVCVLMRVKSRLRAGHSSGCTHTAHRAAAIGRARTVPVGSPHTEENRSGREHARSELVQRGATGFPGPTSWSLPGPLMSSPASPGSPSPVWRRPAGSATAAASTPTAPRSARPPRPPLATAGQLPTHRGRVGSRAVREVGAASQPGRGEDRGGHRHPAGAGSVHPDHHRDRCRCGRHHRHRGQRVRRVPARRRGRHPRGEVSLQNEFRNETFNHATYRSGWTLRPACWTRRGS